MEKTVKAGPELTVHVVWGGEQHSPKRIMNGLGGPSNQTLLALRFRREDFVVNAHSSCSRLLQEILLH